MALNFPNNPESVNNTYIAPNGVIYHYDGTKWTGQSIEGIVSIPTASTVSPGIVKVDGITINITDGVISSIGESPINIDGGSASTNF